MPEEPKHKRPHMPHVKMPRLRPRRPKGLIGDYKAAETAVKGFGSLLRTERPLRYHFGVHAVMLVAGYKLRFRPLDWLLYLMASERMLGAEINNSVHELQADRHLGPVIEDVPDHAPDDIDPRDLHDTAVGQIKDSAAGTTVPAVATYLAVTGVLIGGALKRCRSH